VGKYSLRERCFGRVLVVCAATVVKAQIILHLDANATHPTLDAARWAKALSNECH